MTSNHIYNLAYNYTAERQYPPKLYNIIQPEDTATLIGKLVYRSNFYLNTDAIAYGSRYYEVYSSSTLIHLLLKISYLILIPVKLLHPQDLE